jgi:hypothetical protein
MADADAQCTTIDSSTATAREARTVTRVRQNFICTKVSSFTGGYGVTVPVLG